MNRFERLFQDAEWLFCPTLHVRLVEERAVIRMRERGLPWDADDVKTKSEEDRSQFRSHKV